MFGRFIYITSTNFRFRSSGFILKEGEFCQLFQYLYLFTISFLIEHRRHLKSHEIWICTFESTNILRIIKGAYNVEHSIYFQRHRTDIYEIILKYANYFSLLLNTYFATQPNLLPSRVKVLRALAHFFQATGFASFHIRTFAMGLLYLRIRLLPRSPRTQRMGN